MVEPAAKHLCASGPLLQPSSTHQAQGPRRVRKCLVPRGYRMRLQPRHGSRALEGKLRDRLLVARQVPDAQVPQRGLGGPVAQHRHARILQRGPVLRRAGERPRLATRRQGRGPAQVPRDLLEDGPEHRLGERHGRRGRHLAVLLEAAVQHDDRAHRRLGLAHELGQPAQGAAEDRRRRGRDVQQGACDDRQILGSQRPRPGKRVIFCAEQRGIQQLV
mmetsp:Transcript_40674/g.130972  ORF Transcript_40674/g.130972 Transcript_40674/m.130972 type:complete len:218 (+) Transcript_40674:1229-1882(+)